MHCVFFIVWLKTTAQVDWLPKNTVLILQLNLVNLEYIEGKSAVQTPYNVKQ